MKKLLVTACISVLVFMAVACSSASGEVTSKDYTPAYSGIEYTVECGLALDGSYGCGEFKPKYVSRPARYYLNTTGGSASVGHGTWESCDVGDWYQDGRCYDERPATETK